MCTAAFVDTGQAARAASGASAAPGVALRAAGGIPAPNRSGTRTRGSLGSGRWWQREDTEQPGVLLVARTQPGCPASLGGSSGPPRVCTPRRLALVRGWGGLLWLHYPSLLRSQWASPASQRAQAVPEPLASRSLPHEPFTHPRTPGGSPGCRGTGEAGLSLTGSGRPPAEGALEKEPPWPTAMQGAATVPCNKRCWCRAS